MLSDALTLAWRRLAIANGMREELRHALRSGADDRLDHAARWMLPGLAIGINQRQLADDSGRYESGANFVNVILVIFLANVARELDSAYRDQ